MKNKEYILLIDTETTGRIDQPLVYDFGYIVTDKQGRTYEKGSYLIYDIYAEEMEKMQSAYYAKKLPLYEEMFSNGQIEMIRFSHLKKLFTEIMRKWQIKYIAAYNMAFDYRALTSTQRYLNPDKPYFYPYNAEFIDTWKMARQTLCKQEEYENFCRENDFTTKTGRIQTTAEAVYAYITLDPNFEEEHTALADCEIEREIMVWSYRQKKKMDKIYLPPHKREKKKK